MNTLKTIFAVLLASSVSLGAAAEKLPSPIIDDDGFVTLNGSVPSLGFGDCVSIAVISPSDASDETDYSSMDMESLAKSAMLASFSQYITDDNGAYTAKFSLGGEKSGYYTLVLSPSDGSETQKQKFYFSSYENKVNFIGEIAELLKNEQTTYTDLLQKLALTNADCDTARLFAIDAESIVFDVDEIELSKVLFERLLNLENLDDMSPSEFKSELEKSALVCKVKKNAVSFDEYKSVFDFDDEFVYDYENVLNSEQKNAFSNLISSSDICTDEQVRNAFCESVIKAVISTPAGWSDYTKMIERHGKYFENKGLDTEAYRNAKNTSAFTDYLKSSYKDIAEFISDVNKALKNDDEKSEKNFSSSGGGGKRTSVSSSGFTMAPVTSVEKEVFSDLSSVLWAKESIEFLAKSGIVNGTGDGKFSPCDIVTREQFVKMVSEAFGIADAKEKAVFADVPSDSWYEKYISAATEAKIVFGMSDGSFGVGRGVSRQDAAVIIYRTAVSRGIELESGDFVFSDDLEISQYAKEAVYAMKNCGVLEGVNSQTFAPNENCTRAQAAKMIYGFKQYIKE